MSLAKILICKLFMLSVLIIIMMLLKNTILDLIGTGLDMTLNLIRKTSSTNTILKAKTNSPIKLNKKLLVLVVVPALFISVKPVFAWWNTNYLYRYNITIYWPSDNPIVDLPINITFNTQLLIQQNKLQPTCSDLRVIYVNPNTSAEEEIPFVIENCGSNETQIIAKIPYLPPKSNVTIYLYYGNPNAQPVNYTYRDIYIAYYTFDYQSDLQDWTFSGNRGWTICTSTPYGIKQGNASACNQDISDNQRACMSLTLNCPTQCVVSFWWAVSSEGGYDFLRFYVDRREIWRISGRVSWQYREYTLSSGTHTIQFCYTKDGSVSRGTDTGYVDYLIVKPYADSTPIIYYGSEEMLAYPITTFLYPANNTYLNYTTIPVSFNITIKGASVTADYVTLLLDDHPVKTWYNVSNNTLLKTWIEASEGVHNLTVLVNIANRSWYSDPVYFTVDLTPPTIIKIEPPAYKRIHYPYEKIPFIVEVRDNYGISNCYVIDWFGVKHPCNTTIFVSPNNVTEDYYTYYIVATDLAGNIVSKSYTILFDISQGAPKIIEYTSPTYIPAVPFNVLVTIACYDDWCDNVKVTLKPPTECAINNTTILIGDMDELETRTLNFTLSCTYADIYNFTINVTSANGNYDTVQFSILPPYLNVYHTPEAPTSNDNITIYVQPVGFGTDVTITYEVFIIRRGIPILLYNNTITIPSDITTPIALVSRDQTEAGDVLYYKVQIIQPNTFPILVEKNVTILEFNPPSFVTYSLKYPTIAPHDDYQEFNVTVIDNTIVDKVELYVDFGTGYILYDTKIVNSSHAVVNFKIYHNKTLVGRTIKMFAVAYDEFGNAATSDIFSYKVVEDKSPTVIIVSPPPGSIINTTSIPLVIKVYDDFSSKITCMVNGIVKEINNNTYDLFNIVLPEGTNTVIVKCYDTYDNTAIKQATYTVDLTPPIIENINYTTPQPYIVEFAVTAKDNILLDKLVYYVKTDNTTLSNTIALSGNVTTIKFTVDMRAYIGKIVSVVLEVFDKAGLKFTLPPIQFAVSKVETHYIPTISYAIELPPRITISVAKLGIPLKLKIYINDRSPLVHCTLLYDSNIIDLGSLPTGKTIYYNIKLPPGSYKLLVMCRDDAGLTGISNILEVGISAKAKKVVTRVFDFEAYTKITLTTLIPTSVGLGLFILGLITENAPLVAIGVSSMLFGPQIAEGIINSNSTMIIVNSALFSVVYLLVVYTLRRTMFV